MNLVAPPGLAWLIGHELRLALRQGSATVRTRAIILAIVLLVPSVVGGALAWTLRDVAAMPVGAFGMVSAILAGMLLLMLSGASVHVLRSFHDRGDLDLLFSAPLPRPRILAAKAVAVHFAVALPITIVVSPFLIASALLGHPGWLGGIAMVLATSVVATSLAFGLAAALFERVGAARARVILQVGGGVFATAVVILGQTPTFAPRLFADVRHTLRAVPPAPFDWPARAFFGEPLPLAVMLALAVGAAVIAARTAADQLGRGAPALVARRPGGRSDALAPRAFRGGLGRILLVKELRLLGRDPELIAAISLQLAYMVPAFALIFIGGAVTPARLAAAAVLFAGLLPASLAWLTICGEDAPDLLAAAPVSRRAIARAKLLAACLPALVIVAVPIVFIAGQSLRAGAVALLLCPVAALAAAAQQGWLGKPQPRRAFRTRQKGSILLAVAEYGLAGGWSWTAALLGAGSAWAVVPAAVAGLVLLGSWRFRLR